MPNNKQKILKRDVVFPVRRGYKFDVEGAVKIAQRIHDLQIQEERESKEERSEHCQCLQR